MANNLIRYILIGVVLLARPIFGDNTATGTASSSSVGGGTFGPEGILTTTTHQTAPHSSSAQSSSFASNQFLQGLMNTPGLAGLAGGGFGGMGAGAFPGMAGFAAPPGSEYGGPSGFVGPSYIPYTWLGSLAGFKGDIIFPLLIIGFVLVGIWTAIQFFMGLIVPWVAAKSWDGGPSAGASFSVAKSGSVSGSSRFLRDLGNAMNVPVPGTVNMELLNQVMAAINKGQKTYESSQPAVGSSPNQNVTMEATSKLKPGI